MKIILKRQIPHGFHESRDDAERYVRTVFACISHIICIKGISSSIESPDAFGSSVLRSEQKITVEYQMKPSPTPKTPEETKQLIVNAVGVGSYRLKIESLELPPPCKMVSAIRKVEAGNATLSVYDIDDCYARHCATDPVYRSDFASKYIHDVKMKYVLKEGSWEYTGELATSSRQFVPTSEARKQLPYYRLIQIIEANEGMKHKLSLPAPYSLQMIINHLGKVQLVQDSIPARSVEPEAARHKWPIFN